MTDLLKLIRLVDGEQLPYPKDSAEIAFNYGIKRAIDIIRREVHEEDKLQAKLDKATGLLVLASKLLEALRMDSGVGGVLGSPQKEVYASIELDITRFLKELEA